MLGPLKLRPILKEKVWGGDALRDLAGKPILPGARIGESWELCDRPEGVSVVAEGPLAGQRLRDILAERGEEVYGRGPGALPNGRFPLLVKFIDAAAALSVQVHPDDAYCEANGLDDAGKTECWYVLRPPAPGLVLGVKPGVTPQRLRERLAAGKVEECLHVVCARAGDLVFCPAGTLHAALPPMVFVEIQQNSDITFRVYDWGRVGLDGKPRELHVERALETMRFEPGPEAPPKALTDTPFVSERMVKCDKFVVDRWRIGSTARRGERPEGFEILICLGGQGAIETPDGAALPVRLGDTTLIPACAAEYTIAPQTPMTLLCATAARGNEA